MCAEYLITFESPQSVSYVTALLPTPLQGDTGPPGEPGTAGAPGDLGLPGTNVSTGDVLELCFVSLCAHYIFHQYLQELLENGYICMLMIGQRTADFNCWLLFVITSQGTDGPPGEPGSIGPPGRSGTPGKMVTGAAMK